MNFTVWFGQLFTRVSVACTTWLAKLFDATDITPVYFYFVGIALTVHFLVKPLIGSKIRRGASDTAKKSKEEE